MFIRLVDQPNLDRALVTLFGLALLYLQAVRFLPISINMLLSVAVVAFVGLSLLKQSYINKVSLLSYTVLVGWLIFPLIHTPEVLDRGLHIRSIWIVGFYTMAGLLFAQLVTRDTRQLVRVFLFIYAFAVLTTFVLMIGHFYLGFRIAHEFSGIFPNRNYMTFSLAFASIVPLVMFRILTPMQRLSTVVLTVMNVIVTVQTASVAGSLGIFLLLGLVSFYALPKRWKLLAIIGVVGVLALVLGIENRLSSRVWEFVYLFTSPEDVRLAGSQARRAWMYVNGGLYVWENPFNPTGLDNERYYFVDPVNQMRALQGEAEAGVGTHLHNNFLGIAVGAGVHTLILYYVPLLWIFFSSLRRAGNDVFFALCATILAYRLWIDIANTTYRDIPTLTMTALAVYVYFVRMKQIKYSKFKEKMDLWKRSET